MLTEQTVIGAITICENGVLIVREDRVILDDGVEVSRTYTRRVLNPGTETTNETSKVADVAAAVWTPNVVAAFEAEG